MDEGGCMWMNVDDFTKNREFMWMTIHLHSRSSTFIHIKKILRADEQQGREG